jgi:hypothetical protein
MASIKRVDGNYDIYANLTTFHGNVNITGNIIVTNTEVVNQSATVTGNLTLNGPFVTNNSPGLNGQILTSNGAGAFWATPSSVVSASGNPDNIQFNLAGALAGNNNFNFFNSNGNVQVGNTLIGGDAVITTFNNNDLILYGSGTGQIFVQDVFKMQFQTGATPTNVASTIQLFANSPGQGGSGLYIVNSSYSDELVSKRKATWIGFALG